MALSIKNEEADRLARQLAALTGESLTGAVIAALRERLRRKQAAANAGGPPTATLDTLLSRYRALPLLDERSTDEILGYNGQGLPG